MFDTIAIVDWSSSATPSPAKPSANAIWIGQVSTAGTQTAYFRTRAAAVAHLQAMIHDHTRNGRKLLIGFDFPMGLPTGFAARLTGTPAATAVWDWLHQHIVDGPDNANNRFEVADQVNRLMDGGGPFWGRPAGTNLAHLPATKAVDYATLGLTERRAVERLVPRAQPVWKCYTTGSVGGQMLMGLPVIHQLSQLPSVSAWPFAPLSSVVLAEVYPSLLAKVVRDRAGPGTIVDQLQVGILAQALWSLNCDSALRPLFDVPPLAQEEGWILGAGHEAALLQAARCV